MDRRSFLLALAAGPAAARAATGAHGVGEGPPHLHWARLLVDQLLPEFNMYGSHPTYVAWADRAAGKPARNRSVCSSLQTHLLAHSYGLGSADVAAWTGLANPQAKDYYAAIVHGRGFARIARIGDILPGDFIAIAYPPHSRPTGHVMLVDETPVQRDAAAPLHGDARQFSLRVIDSATTGHGRNDTRGRAGGGWTTGVGSGTIRLYARDDGTIAGYTWSRRKRSPFYAVADRPVAVGRLRSGHGHGGSSATEPAPFADDAMRTET